jgi:hypothetical protein
MGGATGNAFANTLQAGGMAPESELAREVIQNSCDAAEEGERRVRVVFRVVTLDGDRKSRFVDDLSLPRGIGKRSASIALAPDNCLSNTSQPLQLVFVEDYRTVGLHGDPHHRQSHFHRLLLSVGDATKALSGVSSGGSYGYGKSALSMNSRLRTIVAYSAFKRDCTGASARLMACAYLDAHEFQGKQWTGRAWFGLPRPGNELVVDPLSDEAAHALAERLGFRTRRNGERGTSILVVDSHAKDHKSLLQGIEEWWWPRLVDEELDVVVEADGCEHFPQPRRRDYLLPFIECYWLAEGRAEPTGPHQRRDRLNRLHGYVLGSYGLQLLTSDRAEKFPEEKIGCVAMIRSPKMVVEYAPLGRQTPPAVGAFLADADIDNILKLSEPPNHDRWDHESRRLEIARPDENTARQIVLQVRRRLKDQMRRFQAQASPPRPREDRRLRFLERELGALFRPSSRDGDGQQGDTGPVEIHFREGPAARPRDGHRIETVAKVVLRLRPEADDDRMDAIVRVRVPLLEDDQGREGDLLPVKVESDDAEPPAAAGTEPELAVVLSKNEWVTISVRSEAYDPAWSAKVNVEVTPEAGGS